MIPSASGPVPELVDELLGAADGCIRRITIAPELPHGISAIKQFTKAGVVPVVGHCDADYETAKAGFDAGAGIMTHMFQRDEWTAPPQAGQIGGKWRIRASLSS